MKHKKKITNELQVSFLSQAFSIELVKGGSSPLGSVDSTGNANVPELCIEVVNKQNHT